MIAAFWSNDGMNDDKGTRANAIEEMEEKFKEAVKQVHSQNTEEEEEIDKDNPFFSGSYSRTMEKLDGIPKSNSDDKTVDEVVKQQQEFTKYIDQ